MVSTPPPPPDLDRVPRPSVPGETRPAVARAFDAFAAFLARTVIAFAALIALAELALAGLSPAETDVAPENLEALPYVVQTRWLGERQLAGAMFPSDILGHRNMPNAEYGRAVLGEAHIPAEALGGYRAEDLTLRTDAWGFMSHGGESRAPDARRPGERLVICFGGSTMAGWGAPPRESIAAHLERMLSTDAQPVRVINAGVIAYHSMQELLYFALELSHLDPDVVVFLDGFNDEYGRPDERRYLPSLWPAEGPRTGASALLDALGALAPRTVAFVRGPGDVAHDPQGRFLEAQRAFFDADMEHTLRATVGVATANDIGVVLALQPDLYSKAAAARSPHERGLMETLVEHRMVRPDRAESQAAARLLYQRLSATFARLDDVRLVDLLGTFDTVRETTFFDDGHYTPAGNRHLAEQLATHVRALLTTTPPTSTSDSAE